MATRQYIVGPVASDPAFSELIYDLRNCIGLTNNDALEIVAKISRHTSEPARLVEAATQAEAIRHVARKYQATVATSTQVRDLMLAGVVPEVAGE